MKKPFGLMALVYSLPVLLVVLLLDQSTKLWALSALQGMPRQSLTPLVDLKFAWNPNVALSIPIPGPDWMKFVLIPFIMLGLAWFLWREGGRHNAIGAGLILGGALGNFIDRVIYPQGVVDFLVFHIAGRIDFFIFNIADAAITLGVIWLFVEQLVLRPRRNAQAVVS